MTFRFISDPAAQVAALLAGDVDAFPRAAAARSVAQFKADPRFKVLIGGSRAKTILGINNKKKPLDDVRVRRAILAAIDRKAMIEGAVDGFGAPIGSYYTPGDARLCRHHRHQPLQPREGQDAARGSRREDAAGAHPHAAAAALRAPGRRSHRGAARQGRHHRQDRERRMGAVAVAGIYRQRSAQFRPHHRLACRAVRPREHNRARLLLGYNNEAFNALYEQIKATPAEAERAKLLGDAQRMLATDAVAGFLFQPQWITIANKKLKGVWKEVPQFENDFSAWAWD